LRELPLPLIDGDEIGAAVDVGWFPDDLSVLFVDVLRLPDVLRFPDDLRTSA